MRNDTCKEDVSAVVFVCSHRFHCHFDLYLINLCVVKSLRCMCFGVKAKSQHTIFRCNVEFTSLTTSIESSIVFDLGLAVRRGYTAFFFQ